MAGGVLVKEGVVEQEVLVGNRAVVGDQGRFAEVGRSLVHGDGGFQGLLSPLRAGLHDFALLHHEAELVDDVAVVDQRHGGIDHAVGPGFQGGGEDLLRGDVGDIGPPRQGPVPAALPDVALGELHRQVRAQGIGIVQGFQTQGVQLLQAALQGFQVLPPALHGLPVAGDADGGENRVPESRHGLRLPLVRENPGGPGGDGNGGDAPGEAAAHLEAVKILEGLAAGPLGPDDALGVHPLQILRVRGGDGQVRRALQGLVIEKMPPPEGHGVEDLLRRVEVFHPGHGVVGPVHHHLGAPGVIRLLGAEAGKRSALHRGGNDHPLAGAGVQAHPDQQAGVFAELVFHGSILSVHTGIL